MYPHFVLNYSPADRIAYSLIPDQNITAKIQLNFKGWQVPPIKAHFRILCSCCYFGKPDP